MLFEFTLNSNGQSQGLIASNWKIDELGKIFQPTGNIAQTHFINQPGRRFTVSVDLFDPFTDCHFVCCKVVILPFPVGTEEVLTEEVKIYPNPTIDKVQIEHPFAPERMELYSLQGQRLYLQTDGDLNHLSLTTFASGIYILKIYYGEGRVKSQRLIKH